MQITIVTLVIDSVRRQVEQLLGEVRLTQAMVTANPIVASLSRALPLT